MRTFLTAEWRHLLMLNYEVERELLEPLVPQGTESDSFQGRTFVSVVGFQFLKTRVGAFPIPWHRNFEEVNLRFYVRRRAAEGWRRGVVFVRELVPRRAIAFVARHFYGEPYLAVPMRHAVEQGTAGLRVKYAWLRGEAWEFLRGSASGDSREIAAGSEEEFITEHYWGYTARGSRTSEYQVEHPRWRAWRCEESQFEADVASLYGERFASCLQGRPSSAFIADGSHVTVRGKSDLPSAIPATKP
jgi:uncharacterized protein YqjF (DUF2071 family)